MAGEKDNNFLKKLALKRGCTVAAMLAVATATQDGPPAPDKMPDSKTNPVEKTVQAGNTSAPILRTPDSPIPQDTLDLGGPVGFNIDGLQMPETLPVRNIPQPEAKTPTPETHISPDIVIEYADDAKEAHYEVCKEGKEEIAEDLAKLDSGKYSQAEQDSLLVKAYGTTMEIGASKVLNLILSPTMAKMGLETQKIDDIADKYLDGQQASTEDMKQLKEISKDSKKLASWTTKEIDGVKKEFGFDVMRQAMGGEIDRDAMRQTINNGLKHAESFCAGIEKQNSKEAQKEDKEINKKIEHLYYSMTQKNSR